MVHSVSCPTREINARNIETIEPIAAMDESDRAVVRREGCAKGENVVSSQFFFFFFFFLQREVLAPGAHKPREKNKRFIRARIFYIKKCIVHKIR